MVRYRFVFGFLLGVSTLAGFGLCAPAQQESTKDDCCSVVQAALEAVERVRPGVVGGITRSDIEREFMTEGGISSRTQRAYVYKRCRFIKIMVVFIPDSSQVGPMEESQGDVVKSVFQPYLQYSIAD